jgi:hypothetical protein
VTPGDGGPLNRTRHAPGQRAGHYESFYLRANHPERPLAFWIRYTIFSPAGRPEDAVGELWAIVFDREAGRHLAVKEEHPLASCRFERDTLGARVGQGSLAPGRLYGRCRSNGHSIEWDLGYDGAQPPIHLLALPRYEKSFPRAKSLVGLPLARFDGRVAVDGRVYEVVGWTGSQNHNWGSRHTDHYAFGQVAGFDDAPESFLEVASARLKVGPFWTPTFTPLVLRHRGRDHAFVALPQALRARGQFGYFDWTFAAHDAGVRIEGRLHARAEDFVGLAYRNPPGGIKQCLNSKLASCEVTVTDERAGTVETLRTAHRAAFEILTEDGGHGVSIQV